MYLKPQGIAQLAQDQGLHPEVVDSKLHYHTGATGEFSQLLSGPGGISQAQRIENPTPLAKKKKPTATHSLKFVDGIIIMLRTIWEFSFCHHHEITSQIYLIYLWICFFGKKKFNNKPNRTEQNAHLTPKWLN